MKLTKISGLALSALCLAGCQEAQAPVEPETTAEASAAVDESQIVLGNGEANSISTEGISRTGSVFTVPQITIARQGWLVMHPFRDGAPVRDEYSGSTLLQAGTSTNVEIDVGAAPETGDMFIIMLHNDMNEDGVFDFGDGKTVPDAPTFEGTMLIAHPIATPADDASAG